MAQNGNRSGEFERLLGLHPNHRDHTKGICPESLIVGQNWYASITWTLSAVLMLDTRLKHRHFAVTNRVTVYKFKFDARLLPFVISLSSIASAL